MKILIIDNYDSFTYNLVHLLKECGQEPVVRRNDRFELEAVSAYDKIVLSPGPGIPLEAGFMMDVIKTYSPQKSILGVCLGMQGIAEAFGAELFNLSRPVHGCATEIKVTHAGERLFKGLPERFKVGRYHSWAVNTHTLPSCLKVTALADDATIMALKHEEYDVWGVQFHPESILTEYGKEMIINWLNRE